MLLLILFVHRAVTVSFFWHGKWMVGRITIRGYQANYHWPLQVWNTCEFWARNFLMNFSVAIFKFLFFCVALLWILLIVWRTSHSFSAMWLSMCLLKNTVHWFLSFSFRLQKEESCVPSGYIENERSMLKLLYNNVFFVARKPLCWKFLQIPSSILLPAFAFSQSRRQQRMGLVDNTMRWVTMLD